MKNKTIKIFEFPSNLGLKKKEMDPEPGVKFLPDWFRQNRFHELIGPAKVMGLRPPDYSMDIDVESGVRNAEKIIKYARDQADLINKNVSTDDFFIALGGDCSILIGITLALKRKGEYGLFFLDGHTDFFNPELSESKAVAAMELAIITGYGHKKLTNIQNLGPYVRPEKVWCVGNRENNPKVIDEIEKSEIHYIDLKALRLNGIKKSVLEFVKMVDHSGLDGFFIHLDVDVLNDDIMPAVDSRNKGGLQYNELNQILEILLSNNMAIGIEITILDPTLDVNAIYAKELIQNLTKTIKSRFKPSPYTG